MVQYDLTEDNYCSNNLDNNRLIANVVVVSKY